MKTEKKEAIFSPYPHTAKGLNHLYLFITLLWPVRKEEEKTVFIKSYPDSHIFN